MEPHDSIERYTSLGVECYLGEAKIISPYEVMVNGNTLTTRNIVVATGARPSIPPIEGIENIEYLTSDTIWNIREQPKNLLVLGGGPIGSELAQAFSRLGSHVTQVERNKRLISKEDPEISQMVLESFQDDGVNVLVGHTPKRFFKRDEKNFLECENNGNSVEVEFDTLLIALGRKANTTGFGLEELGVELTAQKKIKVDEYMNSWQQYDNYISDHRPVVVNVYIPIYGDVNEDGNINILDITTLINFILAETYSEIADLNEDGGLNILDIVILINLILDY